MAARKTDKQCVCVCVCVTVLFLCVHGCVIVTKCGVWSTAYNVCGSAPHLTPYYCYYFYVSLHDHLSPSPADGVDEEVGMFASCLKSGNMRKLELTECRSLSPMQIATILSGLKGNSSLKEVAVTLYYGVSHVMKCDSLLCVLEGMVVTPSPQVSSECVVCLSRNTV